jgi:type VI secretion system protein ImpK
MQTAVAEMPTAARPRRQRGPNDLLNLASPLLELVLKMHAGVVEPSNDVRPLIDDLLRQLREGGARSGYDQRRVRDVEFALVAFIDETMLSQKFDFKGRSEWEIKPLQLIYFQEHLAGEKFFERLDATLAEGDEGADVAEVYYVCLLLGFKGKYNFYLLEEQLRQTIKRTGDSLRAAGRLRPNALSSHWRATDQPGPPVAAGLPLWAKVGLPGLVALALLLYALLYLLLQRELTIVR